MNFTLHTKLTDQLQPDVKPLPLKIEFSNGQIWISPEGYGESSAEPGYAAPIGIELANNHLRVICATDINSEDVQIIDMEGALEGNRQQNPEDDAPAKLSRKDFAEERDNERLQNRLLLVIDSDDDVPLDKIAALTDDEYWAITIYAISLHYAASDNDIVVPPKPEWLDQFEKQPAR